MKKLLIDSRWLASSPRGIGVFNDGLLQGLKELSDQWMGVRITIALQYRFKKLAFEKYGDCFNYIFLPKLPDPIIDFLIFPILQFFWKFDVIHFTGNTGAIYFINRCKLITTIHDASFFKTTVFNDDKTLRQKIGMLYRRALVPKLAFTSDIVVTVSAFAAKDLESEFQSKIKVHFIHHGFKKPTIDAKAGGGFQYFVVVGGADPQKNLKIVFQALNIINDIRDMKIRIKIVGLSTFDYIELKNDTLLFDCVEFCGKLSHQETMQLISNATCTIVPSLYESFGFPVLESLMLGTPVICSNTGALKEIAQDCAIYFDPGNFYSLVGAILEFERSTSMHLKLQEWISLNQSNYSWSIVAKKYLDKYYLLL